MDPLKVQYDEQKQLTISFFHKFLSDASNLLGQDMSWAALNARARIEEALNWGRLAISTFQMNTPSSAVPIQEEQKPTEETSKADVMPAARE